MFQYFATPKTCISVTKYYASLLQRHDAKQYGKEHAEDGEDPHVEEAVLDFNIVLTAKQFLFRRNKRITKSVSAVETLFLELLSADQ